MTTKVPERFYKYRPMATAIDIERVEQVVLGSELFFATAASFNDPFDLFPVMSLDAPADIQREDFIRMSRNQEPGLSEAERQALADKVMKTSLATPDDVKFAQQAIQFFLREYLKNNVGTYCVAEIADDLLMWAHYADRHLGICLEFDGYSTLMAEAQPIHYTQKRDAINHYADDKGFSVVKGLLTKSKHWKYEQEWRLFRPDLGACKVGFTPDTLTGIIIGALATKETIAKVKEWNSKRATPLRLRKARTSNDEFKLIIEDLR